MRNKLITLGIFLLFGIFLMRGGITGFVASENCELGSCDASGLEMPAYLNMEDSMALSGIGLLLVVISSCLAFAHIKYKSSQEKAEEPVKEILEKMLRKEV